MTCDLIGWLLGQWEQYTGMKTARTLLGPWKTSQSKINSKVNIFGLFGGCHSLSSAQMTLSFKSVPLCT